MSERLASPPTTTAALRRRDLLSGGFALAAVCVLLQPGPAKATGRENLSSRAESIVVAAALAMVGPAGEKAHAAGSWDPGQDVDRLLGHLAPDQRRLLNIAFRLLDRWPKGRRPFRKLSVEERREWLAVWRVSDNALQRSAWGVLHAACCSSFSANQPGWDRMGYPGPIIGTDRPLGQTVAFEWDELVP